MSFEKRADGSRVWQDFRFWLAGALVVILLLAAWQALPALLLAFASVIFATMLIAVAAPMQRYISIPRGIALPLAGIILLGIPVVAGILIGPTLKAQLLEFGKAIPEAIETIEQRFNVSFRDLVEQATGAGGAANGSATTGRNLIGDAVSLAQTIWNNLSLAGNFLLSGIAGLIVIVVGGAYLAADPDRYRVGTVRLFPTNKQAKVDHALGNCGRALDRWLRGQAISMVSVGLLAGLGSWAIGLPAPLAIGFINGVLEFIPIIGPWLGAVPVLLLAFGQGIEMIALAAALLLVIQQLESNLITPLAQETMANIPPFVVLFGLIVFGLVFGLMGVLVAGPLTLVAYVLVSEIYVKDALGQEVEVPGEQKSDTSSDDAKDTAQ